MDIAAITSGRNTPSTRFRIRQYIEPLSRAGINIKEYYPLIDKNAGIPSRLQWSNSPSFLRMSNSAWRSAKIACRLPGILASRRADATWLSRELLPGHYTLEKFLGTPLFFDVDDAIWQAKPHGKEVCRKIAEQAQAIIVCNDYLANWFSAYNSNIHIVPTSIDTDRFLPAAGQKEDETFIIGWTGSAGNLHYLYRIEDALHAFLSKHDARLLIISDRAPNFQKLKDSWVRFVPWSPSIEASSIARMDVGLMPLPDSEWSKGKCAFKMLQYLACAVPCIASPVGMNEVVLSKASVGVSSNSTSEFYDALKTLYLDKTLRETLGSNGRMLVERLFSIKANTPILAEIFSSQH